MNGRLRVDSAGLRGLASQLREGASALDEPARSVPAAPDAGVSSGAVSAALESILRSSAGLVARMNESAAQIDASDGSYGAVDNHEAHRFGEIVPE